MYSMEIIHHITAHIDNLVYQIHCWASKICITDYTVLVKKLSTS